MDYWPSNGNYISLSLSLDPDYLKRPEHGFYRHYDVSVEGNVWTFSGEHERARIEFSPDNRQQLIVWEWKPQDQWLPLCDRTATRMD